MQSALGKKVAIVLLGTAALAPVLLLVTLWFSDGSVSEVLADPAFWAEQAGTALLLALFVFLMPDDRA